MTWAWIIQCGQQLSWECCEEVSHGRQTTLLSSTSAFTDLSIKESVKSSQENPRVLIHLQYALEHRSEIIARTQSSLFHFFPPLQGAKRGRQLFILIAWPPGSPHFASMHFSKNHIYFSNVCKLKTSEELWCLGEHSKTWWKSEPCFSVIHLETCELNVRIFQLPGCFKSMNTGAFNQLMNLIDVYSIWRQIIFLWSCNDRDYLNNIYK